MEATGRREAARLAVGAEFPEALMRVAADPAIEHAGDVIVKVDSATICGTDLHILKGDVPEVKPGTILGHEAVGTVSRSVPR